MIVNPYKYFTLGYFKLCESFLSQYEHLNDFSLAKKEHSYNLKFFYKYFPNIKCDWNEIFRLNDNKTISVSCIKMQTADWSDNIHRAVRGSLIEFSNSPETENFLRESRMARKLYGAESKNVLKHSLVLMVRDYLKKSDDSFLKTLFKTIDEHVPTLEYEENVGNQIKAKLFNLFIDHDYPTELLDANMDMADMINLSIFCGYSFDKEMKKDMLLESLKRENNLKDIRENRLDVGF